MVHGKEMMLVVIGFILWPPNIVGREASLQINNALIISNTFTQTALVYGKE